MDTQSRDSPVSHRLARIAFRHPVLILVALSIFLLLGLVVFQVYWIRWRHEFIAAEREITAIRGANVVIVSTYPHDVPIRAPGLLWAFGEKGFSGVYVLADKLSASKLTKNDAERVRRAKSLFPEATTYLTYEHPGGPPPPVGVGVVYQAVKAPD